MGWLVSCAAESSVARAFSTRAMLSEEEVGAFWPEQAAADIEQSKISLGKVRTRDSSFGGLNENSWLLDAEADLRLLISSPPPPIQYISDRGGKSGMSPWRKS